MNQHHHKPSKSKPPMPKQTRLGLRILGIVLIVAAMGFCIKALSDAADGHIEFGRNYRGVSTVSNRAYRFAFVLGIAGVAFFGCSFPINKDKNDKDSS
jgi:hypothetical protein